MSAISNHKKPTHLSFLNQINRRFSHIFKAPSETYRVHIGRMDESGAEITTGENLWFADISEYDAMEIAAMWMNNAYIWRIKDYYDQITGGR